ncbi:alpha/beta fold hydrolase [Pseudoalteromonas tunicata]|uniref:Hydrolase, alpha/beta hydrolase fold family protein n=1 Tax=Pseudoalteromonas tunicata D2 TaxID=87626 RepID=A4CDS2_9GAMM|nr:alpha/beta hydrolase [Pseudoalteromonas tunicata]ATC96394.1 hypothetical protein PTUN_a4187 [Pseudoalteromonas tunicata]AXT31887.1 alpha/beta hydrolase [Pseudoalteromonas tunicata]EAR27114.1 hydrolase, alpha/beta hydrolase fold family protein [Pseudoalteromonas tunicata D2]
MNHLTSSIKTALFAISITSAAFALPAWANTHLPLELSAQATTQCACFNVEVFGQGPALILIPGLTSTGEVWQHTVDALKGDYQLHVLTLAGFGGVKALPAHSWGEGYLAKQQQAIINYIDVQKLDKPIIIGHSLGGYLALNLAVFAPDLIGGAINVDGLPALGALFAEHVPANADGQKAASPRNFDPMEMAKGMASEPQWQQRIANDMRRADGMTSGRVMGELMQADLRPALATMRVPVLTLGALQNGAPYSTPEQVEASYKSQLANAPAQYHSFAFAHESKHFIMADAPTWLNQQIETFVQQHATKG